MVESSAESKAVSMAESAAAENRNYRKMRLVCLR